MRAVVLAEPGPPEALAVQDVPEPDLEEGQSLVRVRASGVNFLDVLVRQGRYPQMPELPTVLGTEVAGETEDGRRVVGLVRASGGGYAERVGVDDRWLFDLPDGASFAEGASFLMTFLTAWIPLTRQARVEPGSRVLVTAAAGGVGTAAVQAARHLGAEVVAVASTPEKLEVARSLGASAGATYDDLSELKDVDVVLDCVGGETFAAALRTLRPLGAAVAVGFAGGWWQPTDTPMLVGRNISVLGFYLGRLMGFRPDVVRGAAAELLGLWRGGAIRPLVGAELPLERAADAHRLIEERRHTGKVVLVP